MSYCAYGVQLVVIAAASVSCFFSFVFFSIIFMPFFILALVNVSFSYIFDVDCEYAFRRKSSFTIMQLIFPESGCRYVHIYVCMCMLSMAKKFSMWLWWIHLAFQQWLSSLQAPWPKTKKNFFSCAFKRNFVISLSFSRSRSMFIEIECCFIYSNILLS